jgi:hypothetical protein
MTEVIVQWDEESRLRFSSCEEGGFRRVEEEREPCRWRPRGTELVDGLTIQINNPPEAN